MQNQATRFARRNSRLLRQGMTEAEQHLSTRLRGEQLGVKFRRQHPFGNYVADFACLDPKLVIEIDGSQHLQQTVRDAARDAFFAQHGFVTLRFFANEIFTNTGGVLERIAETIQPAPGPHPGPPPEGEGEK